MDLRKQESYNFHSSASDILKKKWFQAGFMNDDEEERIISQLISLFETFSQSYQFPVLISKFFNAIREVIAEGSGGIYYGRAYVPTSLLKTFVNCVSVLPNLQTLNLWEQFLANHEDFFLHAESGRAIQAGLLIASQLFSSFLCHSNIHNMISSQTNQKQIQKLMERTENLVKFKSCLLNLQDSTMNSVHISCLLLILSFRKFKNSMSNFSLFSDCVESPNCCGFSFLSSHDEVGCDIHNLCQPYLDNDDKRISYCMFNLMKEECSSILLHSKTDQGLDNEEKKRLKDIMATLISNMISSVSIEQCPSWDFNINTLSSDDYGVATVFSLITHLPRFLHFVDIKHLSSFCSFAVNILMLAEDDSSCKEFKVTTRQCLTEFFKSSFFTESTKLQTTFISAIWDRMRTLIQRKKRFREEDISLSEAYSLYSELCISNNKWHKYAGTTPENNTDVNSMWTLTKQTADRINAALNDESILLHDRLLVPETNQLVKILNYLPLEYLLPGNQMKCLFGLSLTLFLLGNSSKDNCKDTVFEVIKSVVSILEGVRSVWLFDFVLPGPYIEAVIKVVASIEKQCPSMSFELPHLLFEELFRLSRKNIVFLSALEEHFIKPIENMHVDISSALAFQCLISILSLPMQSHSYEKRKERLEGMTAKCCSAFSRYLKHNRDELQNNRIRSIFIASYAKLLIPVVNSTADTIVEKKQKYISHLPHILDLVLNAVEDTNDDTEMEAFITLIAEALSLKGDCASYVPEDIRPKAWAALKKCLEKKVQVYSERLTLFLAKTNNYRQKGSTVHSVCRLTYPNCSETVPSAVDMDLEIKRLSIMMSISEVKVVLCLVRQSSTEELGVILRDIFACASLNSPNVSVVKVSQYVTQLCFIQAVVEACVTENKLQIISPLLNEQLAKLHFLISQTCSSTWCLVTIIAPSLGFLSFVLGNKCEKLNLTMNNINQCVHSCLAVHIDQYVNSPVFFLAFNSVWRVLSLLLTDHCFATLSSRMGWLPCASNLLKSVVLAGNQELILEQDDTNVKKVQQCANNMMKLFLIMSQNETEFTKIVPYIVADYVDSVHTVTLHPDIKSQLIVGINKLLSMCNEDALKMLSVNIKHSCQYIYSTLVKNYKSVRYGGQV